MQKQREKQKGGADSKTKGKTKEVIWVLVKGTDLSTMVSSNSRRTQITGQRKDEQTTIVNQWRGEVEKKFQMRRGGYAKGRSRGRRQSITKKLFRK